MIKIAATSVHARHRSEKNIVLVLSANHILL